MAGQGVVAGATADPVRPEVADDDIVTAEADDDVVGGRARDGVVGLGADDGRGETVARRRLRSCSRRHAGRGGQCDGSQGSTTRERIVIDVLPRVPQSGWGDPQSRSLTTLPEEVRESQECPPFGVFGAAAAYPEQVLTVPRRAVADLEEVKRRTAAKTT